MADPVTALLTKQSVARLRDMEREIASQLSDLQTQQVWVQRALAEKGASPASASSTDTPGTSSNGNRPKRKRSNKRQAITQVLLTDPARVWLPSEVRDALAAQGIDSTAAAVRVTLRRMGDDGELERPPDGNGWTLANPFLNPPSSPSAPEELDGLNTEGSGPDS